MNEGIFLEDCATCGAKPRSTSWWYDHLHKKYMVSCLKCGADGDWHKAPEKAAEGWNAQQVKLNAATPPPNRQRGERMRRGRCYRN